MRINERRKAPRNVKICHHKFLKGMTRRIEGSLDAQFGSGGYKDTTEKENIRIFWENRKRGFEEIRMKRLIFVAMMLAVCTGKLFAWSETMDPGDSGSLMIVSTGTTQIFSNNPYATRSYIINTSTNNIFLVGPSTTSAVVVPSTVSISVSTGTFFIPASTSTLNGSAIIVPIIFSPDGPADAYRGPMWAQSGSTNVSIQRVRFK